METNTSYGVHRLNLDFVLHIDTWITQGTSKRQLRRRWCFAIKDVWNSNGISSHRAHIITSMKQFQIKNLTILPFSVPHDVENVGFLIADDRGNKMLYLTDCFYSPFRFKKFNLDSLECNYSLDILKRGRPPYLKELKSRLLKSHFSLENVKRKRRTTWAKYKKSGCCIWAMETRMKPGSRERSRNSLVRWFL